MFAACGHSKTFVFHMPMTLQYLHAAVFEGIAYSLGVLSEPYWVKVQVRDGPLANVVANPMSKAKRPNVRSIPPHAKAIYDYVGPCANTSIWCVVSIIGYLAWLAVRRIVAAQSHTATSHCIYLMQVVDIGFPVDDKVSRVI